MALIIQVIGVLAVLASGLETLVLALGGTLLVVPLVLVCHDCRSREACADCVGHADGDNNCRRHVERTTLGSCIGQQNDAVCICCIRIEAIDALGAIIVVAG